MLRYICLFSVSISQLWSADLTNQNPTYNYCPRIINTEQKRPYLFRNAPQPLDRPPAKNNTGQPELNRNSFNHLLILLKKSIEELKSGEISLSAYEENFNKNFPLLLQYFQALYDKLSGKHASPELLSSCIEASEEAERAERSITFAKGKKRQEELIGFRALFLKKASYIDRFLQNNTYQPENNTKQPEFDGRLFDDMQPFLEENKAVLILSELNVLNENAKIENEKIVSKNVRKLLGYFQGQYIRFSKLPASPELLSSCIREAQKAKRAEESFGLTQDNWRQLQLSGCRAMLLIEASFIAYQLEENSETLELATEALLVLKNFECSAFTRIVLPIDGKVLNSYHLVHVANRAIKSANFFIEKRKAPINEGGNTTPDASKHSSQKDNTAS